VDERVVLGLVRILCPDFPAEIVAHVFRIVSTARCKGHHSGTNSEAPSMASVVPLLRLCILDYGEWLLCTYGSDCVCVLTINADRFGDDSGFSTRGLDLRAAACHGVPNCMPAAQRVRPHAHMVSL
jgi:hypothetical protein